MSTVIVLAPLIVAGWPAITAAVTAAIGTMGFTLASAAEIENQVHLNEHNRAEIEVEDSEILQNAAGLNQETRRRERRHSSRLQPRRARSPQGLHRRTRLLQISAPKKIGEELLGHVTQQYVYHRIVTEFKDRNMSIVDEEVAEDHTVKIRVRNY